MDSFFTHFLEQITYFLWAFFLFPSTENLDLFELQQAVPKSWSCHDDVLSFTPWMVFCSSDHPTPYQSELSHYHKTFPHHQQKKKDKYSSSFHSYTSHNCSLLYTNVRVENLNTQLTTYTKQCWTFLSHRNILVLHYSNILSGFTVCKLARRKINQFHTCSTWNKKFKCSY
jgi:hypothetical protein